MLRRAPGSLFRAVWLSTLLVGLTPGVALAQEAEANLLFDQGRELFDQKRFAEAAQKFEQSQALDPAVGTLLNLAECYQALGRTASAWAAYRDASGLAAAARQTDRERYAADRAKEIEAKLSRVNVVVPEEARVEGLVIKRNGKVVPEALWNNPVPVDPGPVMLEASAPGHESWKEERPLALQQSLEVTVPKLVAAAPAAQATVSPPPAPAPTATPPPPDVTEAPPEAGGSGQRTAGLVVGGAGAVLLGVGVYLFVDSRATFERANCPDAKCVEGVGDKTVHDEGRTLERWAYVSGGVGIAALATAAYLLITVDGEGSASVGAISLPGGAGVNVSGRF